MRKRKPKQIDRYQIRFDQEVFVDLFSGGDQRCDSGLFEREGRSPMNESNTACIICRKELRRKYVT